MKGASEVHHSRQNQPLKKVAPSVCTDGSRVVWVPQVICSCSFDCHVLKKSFLQIQRYALVYPREKNDMNVMPENTYSCFSNRSPIQTPPVVPEETNEEQTPDGAREREVL